MTEEEKAKEYAHKSMAWCEDFDFTYKIAEEKIKQAYLAGLHEGQPKWHKPCEMLPKDEKEVLVYMWDSYYIGYYSQRTEENRRWHFEEFSEETEQITAWCEILQFKE